MDELLLKTRLGVSEGSIPQSQYDELAATIRDYQQQILNDRLLEMGAITPNERQIPKVTSEVVEPDVTPIPVSTTDVAAEAAIPNPANALPETPTPVPPQVIAEAQAASAPAQTASDATPPPAMSAEDLPGGQTLEGGELKAPRILERLTRDELEADKDAILQIAKTKDTRALAQVQADARVAIDSIGNERDIANRFGSDSLTIKDVDGWYQALEAANRLEGLNDELSKNARANIYTAMAEFASDAGLSLRATQILWDDMPVEMQIKTLEKQLNKLRAKSKVQGDRVDLTAEEANRFHDEIEKVLNTQKTLKNSREYQSAIAYIDHIQRNPAEIDPARLRAAQEVKERVDEQLYDSVQEFSLIYGKYLPRTSLADKVANFQRSAMLSSPAGAMLDVGSSTASLLDRAASMGLEGLIGRGLNRLTGTPGRFVDRGASPRTLMRSLPNAIRTIGQEMRGDISYNSMDDVIRRRPAINRVDADGTRVGGLGRFIQTARNAATHLTAGIADAEMVRQARRTGLQNGLEGDNLAAFTEVMAKNATPAVKAKAEQIHMTINNMNKNRVSTYLRTSADNVEKLAGERFGKIARNAYQAFTTFVGGNIYNGITDRNVVANLAKISKAAFNRDAEAVVENLSKLGTGASSVGVAYMLSQSGYIVDTNAQGDSWEGGYFKLGDGEGALYIPMAILFPIAPNLVIGHELQKAFNSEDSPESFLDRAAEAVANSAINIAKALSFNTLTGSTSTLSRAIQQGMGGGSSSGNLGQSVSTLASGPIGAFIPSILAGDVNAILNSISLLNPTGEAAEVKAYNEDGSRNYTQEAANRLINRVPVASQTLLDRQEGVLAQNPLDRIVQGSRASGTQSSKEKRSDEVKAISRDLDERGIPNPYDYKGTNSFSDEVQRYRESDNFTIVAEALEAEYEKLRADGAPEKTLKDKQRDIGIARVAEQNAITYPELASYFGAISGVDSADTYSNAEFKRLLDRDDELYNPDLANRLYQIDTLMAEAGVSSNTTDRSKNYYQIPKSGGGRGRGGRGANISTVNLRSINLDNLRPTSPDIRSIPTIKRLIGRELVKPRKITVS